MRTIAMTVLKKFGVDVVASKLGLHDILHSIGIRIPASVALGKLLSWTVLLVFLKAGIDVLEMQSISQSFSSLMGYIPNLIATMVVLLAGMMLAKFVQGMVVAATERFGMDYGNAIGQLVYGVIVIIVGSIAVAQLQLKTGLVDRFLEITLMAIGAALALALGFGTRDTARHVVAGVYVRESFLEGMKVTVGEQSGKIVAVQAVNTKIETKDGSYIYVPNAQLIETVVGQEEA
jgi:small-conductance mechanosensitive channel